MSRTCVQAGSSGPHLLGHNQFIYLFEGHTVLGLSVRELRDRMVRRGDQLVTSMMTLAEVQVKAMRASQIVEAKPYKHVVAESSLIVPFDEIAAEAFVTLRAQRND